MDKLKTAVIGYGKVAHTTPRRSRRSPSPSSWRCAAATRRRRGRSPSATACGPSRASRRWWARACRRWSSRRPHPAHAAVTVPALRAGAHAIVEKPLASSLEDCDAMIAAARESGRTLAMISQRRLVRAGAARPRGDRRRQARPARARHRDAARLAERGVLPQRPVAGQLGGRGRGRPREPGPAPDRHPAVVHGRGRRALRRVGEPQPPVHRGGGHLGRGAALPRAGRSGTSS